ncbi:hypothetical protein HCUR_00291 [Holospora curviuscula]|uniref:Uncharacterized protein n=1 Tax=Holospora curviuscula TaxID=1082868 RepID=A0A2S5RDD5_9PROT|nr:hypothetical protein HCUR_00291 [Holospora curviuscula]
MNPSSKKMTNIIDLDFYRNFNIVLTIEESDLMSFCYYLQPVFKSDPTQRNSEQEE